MLLLIILVAVIFADALHTGEVRAMARTAAFTMRQSRARRLSV